MRRRRALMLFGLGAAAVTGTALGTSRLVKSPQELRAEQAPPEPTVLTAPAERRVLTNTVVLRGQVGAQSTVAFTPQPSVAGPTVLTGVRVRVGQRFGQGKQLLEISGRPLVALKGKVPAYRDLRPGMQGRDVAQLQAALSALGHPTGDSRGTFGAGTKSALNAFYRSLGYPVPTTGDASEQALAAAVDQARQADRRLTQRTETLDALRAAPPAPVAGRPDPVKAAEQEVRFARQDRDAARAARTTLERTTGPMLPLSEVIFLPSFPGRVEKLAAGVGGDVKPPLMTLSSGALVVRADVSPAVRGPLKTGLAVRIVSELLGLTAHGVVASIGELQTDGSGDHSYPMSVRPTAGPFPERLNDADVRLTVLAASSGHPVLVVPVSAVFAGADGQVSVLRQSSSGQPDRVVVTPGMSGDGYVEITSVEGTLQPRDLVVVGDGGRP
jgi:HlyD family secretion protein